jgi:hypothetical protein
MNKKLTTIWGVGLVVVLMVSLLVGAVPASAKNLDFTPETLPSATNLILAAGSNPSDIAVSGDGQTIYVAAAGTTVYKSTDGGTTFSAKSTAAGGVTPLTANLIAVAPDDSSIVAIAGTANATVYVSTNGATTWGTLAVATGLTTIVSMDLSTDYSGSHYVAVTGSDGANTRVLYYKLGIGGAWTRIDDDNGYNITGLAGANATTNNLAVAFSPNFSSDQVLLALTDNGTHTGLEMYSVNLGAWNAAAGFNNFPVRILNSSGNPLITATSGSLAPAPTYLGGDEVERVVFIGINGGAAAADKGVYRVEDYTTKSLKSGVNVWSVAYDGNVLAAGTTDVRVWRSNDALASTPTFYVSAETKSPGGATNAVLAYTGANLACVTTGSESAFSVSTDSGMSFNDISLIDTEITTVLDGAVAADGSVKYFLSNDVAATEMSLWRKSGSSWQRTLSTSDTNCIIRIAPDNPDVVYVAKPAAKTLYFSKDGGTTRWYSRTCRYNMQDLAVESEDVAYIAQDNSGSVSKTVNSGFTWGTAKSAQLMNGNIHSITCVAEDQLIVGSVDGYVSYSTDGAGSWTRLESRIWSGAGATPTLVHAASSGLDAGGKIYACAENKGVVTRWDIGKPVTLPWTDLLAPSTNAHTGYGVAIRDGVLYCNTANGTDGVVQRTLDPTVSVPAATKWGSWNVGNSVAWNAQVGNLIVTDGAFAGVSGHSIYVLQWGAIPGWQWVSCVDTLALGGPAIAGPVDGKEVRLNPISGGISNVSLSWNRISEATSYAIQVAYDSAFSERLGLTNSVVAPLDSTSSTAAATIAGADLDLGTTYYWRVKADEANGSSATPDAIDSPWSEVRSFTVESGGTVSPGILSPENGGYVAQTSPSFSWAPVSGATRYEFQLSADTSFAAPLASTQHAAAGASPDVTLEVGNTYYWRIRAIEPSEGEWSTIANFTVSETMPGEAGEPNVTVTVPDITIPPITVPPATVNLPPTPETQAPISEGLLWAVIIIGAVLVIALIVLIVRTRRTV